MFTRSEVVPALNRQTDRQTWTDGYAITYRAVHTLPGDSR